MSEMDERREAGRNIRRAYEFLLATHNSIAQIFRSADQILSERQPPWLSNYKGASWNNSSSIDYPDKWIPRFFTRAWTRTEENGRWKRALAFYVSEYGEEVIEPWMGCFLVEAVRDDGFDETGAGQWWNWAWRLDTGSPVRSLLIAIFSWVAEQERARLVERTKAGLERARRAGKKIGRPRRRFDVERARKLRASGMSLRKIAADVGVPQATLMRALARAA
jgi:hypothetical protein